VLGAVAAAAFLFVPMLRAEEPIAPDAQKQQAPDEAKGLKKEAEPSVEVTDAAKPVVDKMRDAYAKLGGLQTAGTWSAQWDIDGEQGKESAEFTSSYAAPNKFRHEIKDDLLFGSTGEKAYGLRKNQYFTEEAPKAHVAVAELPKNAGPLLKEKDPSLLLAVTSEPTPFLAEGATKIDKGDDVKIGDASFTSLKITTKQGADVTVLLDPATSLVRKWTIDMKSALEARGRQNVKAAAMTIDYTTINPEAPAGGNEAFAWTPPAGAKDAAKMAAAGDDEGAAAALKGKPAPAFALKDLDGKDVKLADLKGSVVVLDFWATWCPPCRAGLPILDKVAAARKDKGLKVYAVNIEEDKDAVAAFKKETKLGLSVLLDSTGETGKAYGANAIPETVIIGKDGTVKKVMVGLHDQATLEKEIDEVLKG
jgi:thiol-disulfide isomerase/thioredoxin